MTWDPIKKALPTAGRILILVFLIVLEIWAWRRTHDPLVALYVFLSILFFAARILEWPKPSWWGSRRLDKVKLAWGKRKFDRTYTPAETVSKIGDCTAVRSFFVSNAYQENTERLCNQYQDGLVLRAMGFGLTALFIGIQDASAAVGTEDELGGILRIMGLLLPAFLGLTWDFSRFERQRIWNREIRAPQ